MLISIMPISLIQKLEGLTLFLISLHLFNITGQSWIIYIVFFLAPDIAALGYLKNKKTGALTYNLVHNYVFAFAFIFLGVTLQSQIMQLSGIIVLGHTGLDRFLGYNLKKLQ